MKKTISFFSLFLVLALLLVGCENSTNSNENESYLIEINYSTFTSKVDSGEDFILEVVQTGCSNCTTFTPKFETVLTEYQITAYSLNLSNMSDVNKTEFLDTYEVSGTPTVMFFKNGKETSTLKRLTGNQSKEKIISKLEANGYISE